MRAVALMAAVLLVASCSQPTPVPQALPSPAALPEASGNRQAPEALTPTATPAPGSSTETVPAIAYPDTTGAATPPPEPVGGSGGGGGSADVGADPPPASSAPSQAPPPDAPGTITLDLDRQRLALAGGFRTLTHDPQVLLYQYGPDASALTDEAPGCLRIGIKLASLGKYQAKQLDVAVATVSYTQRTGSGTVTYLGNYKPGNGASELMLDASAPDGKLNFTVRGMLVSDGGGYGGGAQMFLDWTVLGASMALATPADTPSPEADDDSFFDGWSRP